MKNKKNIILPLIAVISFVGFVSASELVGMEVLEKKAVECLMSLRKGDWESKQKYHLFEAVAQRPNLRKRRANDDFDYDGDDQCVSEVFPFLQTIKKRKESDETLLKALQQYLRPGEELSLDDIKGARRFKNYRKPFSLEAERVRCRNSKNLIDKLKSRKRRFESKINLQKAVLKIKKKASTEEKKAYRHFVLLCDRYPDFFEKNMHFFWSEKKKEFMDSHPKNLTRESLAERPHHMKRKPHEAQALATQRTYEQLWQKTCRYRIMKAVVDKFKQDHPGEELSEEVDITRRSDPRALKKARALFDKVAKEYNVDFTFNKTGSGKKKIPTEEEMDTDDETDNDVVHVPAPAVDPAVMAAALAASKDDTCGACGGEDEDEMETATEDDESCSDTDEEFFVTDANGNQTCEIDAGGGRVVISASEFNTFARCVL